MSAELTDMEAVTMAANLNADTVREQRRELRDVESRLGHAKRLIEQLLDPKDLMCRIRAREFLANERDRMKRTTPTASTGASDDRVE